MAYDTTTRSTGRPGSVSPGRRVFSLVRATIGVLVATAGYLLFRGLSRSVRGLSVAARPSVWPSRHKISAPAEQFLHPVAPGSRDSTRKGPSCITHPKRTHTSTSRLRAT